MKLDYFKIFSTCLITKGPTRCLISDLQQEKTHLVSLDFFEIIDMASNQQKPVSEIRELYGIENVENQYCITEYLDYLLKNNLGFYCSEEHLQSFPPLSTIYKTPCKINSAIIEITNSGFNTVANSLQQLNKLNCKFLSLIVYETLSREDLLFVDKQILQSEFISYDLYIDYNTYTNSDFRNYIDENPHKIVSLFVFSSPLEKDTVIEKGFSVEIIFSAKDIIDFKHCGIVDAKYFNTNIQKFTESLNHNSCLHKKISIDKDGAIKNCPSMPQSFGNIKDVSLEEALDHPDFKKYWNITKDQIEVCRDCEFRHVCTDCRAFKENPDNDYSKPLKCGYDPYTGIWDEWTANPLKQKAIEYYGMQRLVKEYV